MRKAVSSDKMQREKECYLSNAHLNVGVTFVADVVHNLLRIAIKPPFGLAREPL